MTYTESLESNEFILSLSNEYKTIFLKALAYLANIDGRRDEQEILYIKDAAEYYKIDCPEKLFEKVSEEEMINEIKKITNRRVCLELIKEMCLLGHSDSDLTEEETLFIGHVGIALGIELDKIEQISNWVIDKIIWLEQGKVIFED